MKGMIDKSDGTQTLKYAVCETTSDQENEKIKNKVEQLESKIAKLISRHQVDRATTCRDVTSLVGAATLVLFCRPSDNRRDLKMQYQTMVSEYLDEEMMPNLWRLAESRRFFVAVLAATESPSAASLRSADSLITTIRLSQQTIEEKQDAIEERQDAIEKTMESISNYLRTIDEKLDTVLDAGLCDQAEVSDVSTQKSDLI